MPLRPDRAGQWPALEHWGGVQPTTRRFGVTTARTQTRGALGFYVIFEDGFGET